MRNSGEFPETTYTEYISLITESEVSKPQDILVIYYLKKFK